MLFKKKGKRDISILSTVAVLYRRDFSGLFGNVKSLVLKLVFQRIW